MIRRQGEYYICEEDEPSQPVPPPEQPADRQFSGVGDIKDRLAMIKERVRVLREERAAAPSPSRLSLSSAFQEGQLQLNDYVVNLSIPSELLGLESRLEKIQQKILGKQVQRQGVQRGGTIVERIRRLQRKLQEMIKNKSIEIINQNINQYSSNLDEKEENFKHLYLYEVFNKTQGLTAEIDLLEKYLTALARVQRSINSLLPLPTLINTHNSLLTKKQEIAARIDKMFQGMKQEYHKLLAQIDAIQV